jgi:hypothetical protein
MAFISRLHPFCSALDSAQPGRINHNDATLPDRNSFTLLVDIKPSMKNPKMHSSEFALTSASAVEAV